MRVLMTSWAWPTHYYPMVPLGWALRTAGHDVHVASQPALTHTITQSGHTAVPIGEDVDYPELVRRHVGEDVDFAASIRRQLGEDIDMAEVMRRGRQALSPAARERWQELRRESMLRGLRPFAAIAEAMVDGLVDYARAWRPDVIIYEPTTYAAPITATALNIPTVRHLWGIDYTHQTHHYEPQALANLYQQLHLDNVNTLGDLTIDPCPPTAQTPANYPRQLIRYIPYNGPGTHPTWLHTPPTQPRICLTWGTSSTRLSEHLSFVNELIDAAAELDAEVVVAVSHADHELLAPTTPPHVRVVEQLPLHLLLPTCDLIVHQGGMGTTMTAITHGTPQIVIPQLPDQIFNARHVEQAGVAAWLDRAEASTGGVLREQMSRMLGSAEHRERASALRSEALRQPSPAEAVAAVERVARHAGQTA